MSDGASFETERWRDDQPEREDLLDPEDIEADVLEDDDVDLDELEDDDPAVYDPEELPESQGADVLEAERLTEDGAARPRLSDEEP